LFQSCFGFKNCSLNLPLCGFCFIFSVSTSYFWIKIKTNLHIGKQRTAVYQYVISTRNIHVFVHISDLLWTAPELVRMVESERPMYGTQRGDIYSYGIILQQIANRGLPFSYKRRNLEPERNILK